MRGSVGLMEVASNMASASAASGLGVGDGITISRARRGRPEG